jgi:hypothetical protein
MRSGEDSPPSIGLAAPRPSTPAAADPEAATTAVRRVDDTRVLRLRHEAAAAFLADLPDTA